MAEITTTNGEDALEERLSRLTKKPGVRASLVLDRATGNILKTTGELAFLRTAKSKSATTATSFSNDAPTADESVPKGIEDFAAMIWNYVGGSNKLVQELEGEDELKLLRIRTKKQEIVIVPDAKYLLTVVHDTPPA